MSMITKTGYICTHEIKQAHTGFFKKNSHGTWQASNVRSPLQPPLQSCNWKGVNVPNMNGCFFWRPMATTRKKQLWSWGARGDPTLESIFLSDGCFFNEEPGIIYRIWLEFLMFKLGRAHKKRWRFHMILLRPWSNSKRLPACSDGLAWRSLATTESGHLRPQTKNRVWVTCDHKVRSLTTTKRHIRWQGQQNLHSAHGHLWPHFAVTCDQKLGSLGLIRITCTHARGGWGGWRGWDDNVPCTCTHTSRTHRLYPCTGWVGWVGWDDKVPYTCTHTSRTHHLYPCARWVGWLGWVGWVGWYVQRLVSRVKILPHLPETVYFPFLYAPPFSTFFRLFPLHFCTPEVWGII